MEIRASDLQFTTAEVEEFLHTVGGVSMESGEIASLASRTEGWIAGLQMIAASLRNCPDPSRFVRELSADNRFVLDYLVEEVFARLDPDLQEFLLGCSVLERLNPDLCKAVTGRSDAAELLEYADKNNLFVTPLDDGRHWYRLHHLFGDVLYARLEQAAPEEPTVLHARAAEWLITHGHAAEAVDHLIAANRYQEAAELVEGHAEKMMMSGKVRPVMRWITALPSELPGAHPVIDAIRAWISLLSGEPMERVEEKLSRIAGGPFDALVLSLRAYIAIVRGRSAEGIGLANKAMEKMPERYHFLKGFACLTGALAQILSGDMERAFDMLARAGDESLAAGNVLVAVLALAYHAEIRLHHGQVRTAETLYERALALSSDQEGTRIPCSGAGLQGLGLVEWLRGNLEEAVELFRQGIDAYRGWFGPANIDAYIGLARALDSLGRADESDVAIAEAEQLARQFDATEFDDRLVDCVHSELLIRRGRVAEARAIRDDGPPVARDDKSREINAESFIIAYEALIEARLRIEEGDVEKCIGLAERLAERARELGRLITALDAELLLTRAYWRSDRADAAFAALERALLIAGPEGIVQRFVDEGPEMARILYESRTAGNRDEFIGAILAKFPLNEQSSAAASVHDDRSIDALTAREVEVLTLLSRGLSNKEAASELCVSVRTVKWHTSHIYAKLDVTSRTQAIARARQLGILAD